MYQDNHSLNQIQKKPSRDERKELTQRSYLLSDERKEAERVKQKAQEAGEHARDKIHQLANPSANRSEAHINSEKPANRKGGVWLICSLLVICLCFVIFSQTENKKTMDSPKEVMNSVQTFAPQYTQHTEIGFRDGSIFPESSSRFLSEKDISALDEVRDYSKIELIQFAINELYARNHYSFKQKDWEVYYEGFSWYSNWNLSDEEAYALFNDYEKYNLKLLTETRKTLRGE